MKKNIEYQDSAAQDNQNMDDLLSMMQRSKKRKKKKDSVEQANELSSMTDRGSTQQSVGTLQHAPSMRPGVRVSIHPCIRSSQNLMKRIAGFKIRDEFLEEGGDLLLCADSTCTIPNTSIYSSHNGLKAKIP